jgi:hypothetical protein
MPCRRVRSHCRKARSPPAERRCTKVDGTIGRTIAAYGVPRGCDRAAASLIQKAVRRIQSQARKRRTELRSVWVVPALFGARALDALLHVPLAVGGSRRGAQAFSLRELLAIAKDKRKGNASRFIVDVVPRERETRWDVRLSSLWVSRMRDANRAFATACQLAEGLLHDQCAKARIEWHAMIVHPGSDDQATHMDHHKARCYFTLIVPLTDVPNSGGTYFPGKDEVLSRFGDALIFDGDTPHAGLGNRSQDDRIFLYAAIFTGRDNN